MRGRRPPYLCKEYILSGELTKPVGVHLELGYFENLITGHSTPSFVEYAISVGDVGMGWDLLEGSRFIMTWYELDFVPEGRQSWDCREVEGRQVWVHDQFDWSGQRILITIGRIPGLTQIEDDDFDFDLVPERSISSEFGNLWLTVECELLS